MGLLFNKNKITETEETITPKEVTAKEYEELRAKYNELQNKYNQTKEEYKELTKTIENLKRQEYEIKKSINTKSLEYVDQLEGLEFEEYVRKLLIKLGYTNVEKTKASGDFGIDILAEKDNVSYAIQCKLYTGKLGNDCVQEAYAGKKYYKKDLAVVITNSTFTSGAQELAKETNVVLWDRNVLDNMLKKINDTLDTPTYSNPHYSDYFVNTSTTSETYDDELYEKAKEYAISMGKISSSMIQRKFRIGYNRACRLLEQLEDNKIVESSNGYYKPREVLINTKENN